MENSSNSEKIARISGLSRLLLPIHPRVCHYLLAVVPSTKEGQFPVGPTTRRSFFSTKTNNVHSTNAQVTKL
jgi:hypothetical protein